MCDPIHQRSGQHRISKELDPYGELQVRTDHQAGALGPLRDHLKQQLRMLSGKAQVRQDIKNEEIHFAELYLQPA